MFGFQVVDVVATAGFLKAMGATRLVWLWVITLLVSLGTTAGVGGLSDRVPRPTLLTAVMVGTAAMDIGTVLTGLAGLSAGPLYGLLYVAADQQYFLLPMVFWTMVNDVVPPAQNKRAFPLIQSGAVVAQVVGNAVVYGLSYLYHSLHGSGLRMLPVVLGLNLFAMLLGVAMVRRLAARDFPGALRQQAGRLTQAISETHRLMRDYWRNLPVVRYLAAATLLVEFTMMVVQYHFLRDLDRRFSLDGMARFLSAFTTAAVALTAVIQWLLSGRMLERVGLKSAFGVLPLADVVASAGSLIWLGVVGAAGSQLILQTIKWAWDVPSHAAFQAFVPQERRGRLAAFLDNYLATLGALAGCAAILALSWAFPGRGELVDRLALAAAVAAGAAAFWAAWRFRGEYDNSLLNWRFARRRKSSALDRLDF